MSYVDRDYDETYLGTAADDVLAGRGGNDTLTGAAGNDTIRGGSGNDIAIYTGNFADYAFTVAEGTAFFSIRDIAPGDGDEGTDILSGIQTLRFADGDVAVTMSGIPIIAASGQEAQATAPAVTALEDGGYLVVWQTQTAAGDYGLSGRRFTASGAPAGDEFRIDDVADTSTYGQNVRVAGLVGGGFVVTWSSLESGHSVIRARCYDNEAQALGDDFIVNQTVAGMVSDHPEILALDDGSFLVAWSSSDGTSFNNWEVHARRFLSADQPAGSEITVSTVANSSQPTFSRASGDWIQLAWKATATGGAGTIYRNFLQLDPASAQTSLDGAGLLLYQSVEQQVSTGDLYYPANVVATDTGLIAWQSLVTASGNSHYDILGSVGIGNVDTYMGGSTTAGDDTLPVAMDLLDGGLILAWQNENVVSSVTAWAYGTDESTTEVLRHEDAYAPAVASLGDGGFVVGWYGVVDDQWTIRSQAFDADFQSGGILRLTDWNGQQIFIVTETADIGDVDLYGDKLGSGDITGIIENIVSSIDYTLQHFIENIELTGESDLMATGNALPNQIAGNTGNNTLRGGAGNDTLEGGAGSDTAVFLGDRSGYGLSLDGTGSLVVDGGDGIDTLAGFERLQFDDGTASLMESLPVVQLQTVRHYAKVQAYFLGVLGREATADEASQFTAILQANQSRVWWNAGITTMAGSDSLMGYLLLQSEYTALTSGDSNATLVAEAFQRLTGQTACQDLIDHYVGRLELGTLQARGIVNKMLGDLWISPKGDGTLGGIAGFYDHRGWVDGAALRGYLDRLDTIDGIDITNLDANGNLVTLAGVVV